MVLILINNDSTNTKMDVQSGSEGGETIALGNVKIGNFEAMMMQLTAAQKSSQMFLMRQSLSKITCRHFTAVSRFLTAPTTQFFL